MSACLVMGLGGGVVMLAVIIGILYWLDMHDDDHDGDGEGMA